MPIVRTGELTVDFPEAGSGPPVVLVRSSVSGNRQWRRLSEVLAPKFRVLAVNLLGYGDTISYAGDHSQSLDDQVAIIQALCQFVDGPVRLVGHSFGGAVALAAARQMGDVERIVLLEPNPFRMLEVAGRNEAFNEAAELYASVKLMGGDARWLELAALFADYFSGDGTRAAGIARWSAPACSTRRLFCGSARGAFARRMHMSPACERSRRIRRLDAAGG